VDGLDGVGLALVGVVRVPVPRAFASVKTAADCVRNFFSEAYVSATVSCITLRRVSFRMWASCRKSERLYEKF
jgi:hypothetical protein